MQKKYKSNVFIDGQWTESRVCSQVWRVDMLILLGYIHPIFMDVESSLHKWFMFSICSGNESYPEWRDSNLG